jgi:putative transposase
MAVSFKKISRPIREHGSQPQRRRRFVATTDNNHASLIFLDVARNKIVHGPNQVWFADITYIAIATGIVDMAPS